MYAISVASELTGVSPQMLRVYEQRGLLSPFRTDGGTRRYSPADLGRVLDITDLLDKGLNLAGVEHVLALREHNTRLQAEVELLRENARPRLGAPAQPPEVDENRGEVVRSGRV